MINAKRLAEIETELRTVIPNDLYDGNSLNTILCEICGGATDDHKANCYVPMVYELLDEVKRLTTPGEKVR